MFYSASGDLTIKQTRKIKVFLGKNDEICADLFLYGTFSDDWRVGVRE